jgi:hypothetical protein
MRSNWIKRYLFITSSVFVASIENGTSKMQKRCSHKKIIVRRWCNQGPMLCSQFSAIFDNFRRKNWRFSQKPMLWSNFCIFSFILSQKCQFFRWIFRRKYLKNHNIGPWFTNFLAEEARPQFCRPTISCNPNLVVGQENHFTCKKP